ncbi:unnamed protein product, partial [Closterium sp. NIES-54]
FDMTPHQSASCQISSTSLKPSLPSCAVLFSNTSQVVKLCDFGVARMLPSRQQGGQLRGGPEAVGGADMTAETGTYRWMAPEVMEHRGYDQRADVFSFAITMWGLQGTGHRVGCTGHVCIGQSAQAGMTAETGTYRWMAPEVMEHRGYDQRADVFSLAITMW